MSTIGILTMSRAYNHGALLQAYALKTTLKRLGGEAKIVNYAPPYQMDKYRGVFDHEKSIRAVARNMMKSIHYPSLKKGADLYQRFIDEELNGKDKILCSREDMEQAAEEYDAIIVGSDQMWNMRLPDVTDTYFLDFTFRGKRMTYAVSMGDQVPFSRANEEHYLDLIGRFDKITVREGIGEQYLRSHGISSTVAPDPSILLSMEEWNEFAREETHLPAGGYVFYYSVKTSEHVYQMAKEIGKQLKLPVITCILALKTEIHTDFIRCFDIGPRGFVDCIRNASFVCTDSYHGTLFSILFEKPFFSAFENEASYVSSARRAELLAILQLKDRMAAPSTKIDPHQDIDYSESKHCLYEMKNNALHMLQSVMI